MFVLSGLRRQTSGLCLVLFFLAAPRINAQDIPPETAARIIVSEAADQGLKGMICVGEVLRRRASTKGFYGYQWNINIHQPTTIWAMARKAWGLSANTNFTNGADHFENVHAFGSPWWARHCIKTYEYKDHVFFREVRRRS
jgi:hypothetical protein